MHGSSPEVATAQELQDFNAQNVADTLWAMAKIDTQVPDVLEVPCTAAAQKMLDFNAQGQIPVIFEALCTVTGAPLPGIVEDLCTVARKRLPTHSGP